MPYTSESALDATSCRPRRSRRWSSSPAPARARRSRRRAAPGRRRAEPRDAGPRRASPASTASSCCSRSAWRSTPTWRRSCSATRAASRPRWRRGSAPATTSTSPRRRSTRRHLRRRHVRAPAGRQGAARTRQRDPREPLDLDSLADGPYLRTHRRAAGDLDRPPVDVLRRHGALGRRRPHQRLAQGPDRLAAGARRAHRRVPGHRRQRRRDDRAPARERPHLRDVLRLRGPAADPPPARRGRDRAARATPRFDELLARRVRRARGARGAARVHRRRTSPGSPTPAATACR